MKNLQIITNTLFAAACALMIGTKSFADEPMNLGKLKTDLVTYQSSGEYDKDIASVIGDARAYIDETAEENQKEKQPKKLAIVLDIDDTSLSNFSFLAERSFCADKAQYDKYIATAKDPVIAPTLELYKDAIQHHVAVFFVTGRSDALNAATVKNLKAAGYSGWSGLFFRPKTDNQPSVTPFKTQARIAIEQAGYTIIASIGDQESDLAGEHAQKTFKLPNPYYYLP